LDLGSDEKYATPPEFLELGTEVAKWPGAEGSIVRGKSANADEPPLQAYWNEVDGELRIVFSEIVSGFTLVLNRVNGALSGTATRYWDSGRPEQTAQITAKRVACWRHGG